LQGMGRSLQEISTWFTSLSREFPGNADVWRNMGVVFALQQQPEEALRAFQTALDLRPSDPDTRRAMAEHLVAIKRPNEALRLVQSLREDAPHDPLPLLLSAHVFESLGDYPAAVAFSDKALALSPEHEGVTQARNSLLARRNDLARRIFNEAQELRARGDLRNAVAALDRALVIWPGAVTVLENLAFVLATTPDETLRNGDRALMLIEKRIAMEGSGTFETQATLAAAHAARGDFAQAVTFAEKALEMGKSQPGVNTSRLELALEAYRRSTVWSP